MTITATAKYEGDYIASLYRPERNAPDCDVYVLQPELEAMGVHWSDDKRREVRVPKSVEDLLGDAAFTVVFGGVNTNFAFAMQDRHTAANVFGYLPVRLDFEYVSERADELRDWLDNNTQSDRQMYFDGPGPEGSSDAVYIRLADFEEHTLFRMRWQGAQA